MSTTIRGRIESLLYEHKATQADLARALNISPQAVSNWLRSGTEPKGRRREQIAAFFGMSESELLFGSSGLPPSRVRVINWDQACRAAHVINNHLVGQGATQSDGWCATGVPVGKHTFALRVRDDSMLNPTSSPSFPPGCMIVVEPEMEPAVGDYVIVCVDDEATFCQYIRLSGHPMLKPLNPRYPVADMPDRAMIVGVVRETSIHIK